MMGGDQSWYILPLAASPWPVQFLIAGLSIITAAALAWWLVTKQNKSVGRKTSDYWAVIKDDPMAVAHHRRTIIWAIFGLVTALFWQFLSG